MPPTLGKCTQGSKLVNPYKQQKTDQANHHSACLPDVLYKLQQTLLCKLHGTLLTQVLCTAGHNITLLIKMAGVPKDTCCCLAFWGHCTDMLCPLTHDPITLSQDITDKVVAILQPGAQKLTDQAPLQN